MSRRKRNNKIEERDLWERGPCGDSDTLAGLEGMYPPQVSAGTFVNASTALTLSAMWNGVSLIGTDIASLPCNVIQNTAKGKVPVQNHPVNKLLDFEANPYVDAFHFEAAILIDAILHGNGYAEIVRDPVTLEPVALFNIPHSSITPEIVSDPENSITGNRLVYRLETAEGAKSYLLAEDVLHLKGTTEAHGLIGISLIDKALQSLGLAIACQTNASTYFANGSRADGFLKYNGTMSPKQKDEFRRDFYKEHGGVYRSNRIGFLTGEWSWLPTTIDPDKSQLLEQRQFGVIEVCRWLNLPPVMLQVYDKASLSYEQSQLDYITRTLRPWLERWELELTRKLFSADEIGQGYEVKHDLRARMRGDSAAIASFSTQMFQLGAVNRNEIRDMIEYGKVPGGDVYYVASNNLAPIPNSAPDAALVTPTQTPPTSSPDAVKAVRGVLEAELSRIVRREATAVRKALGKPDEATRIGEFYEGHEALVRESIRPALVAYEAVTGKALDVENVVNRLVARSRDDVLQAEDKGKLLDDWIGGKVDNIIMDMEATWN